MRSGPATRIIIILNCLVVAISVILPLARLPDYVHEWMPLQVDSLLAGAWWEFFTTMWVHAPFYGWGVLHIAFNMITLSMFGRFIEQEIGIRRYLALYFISGFVASLCFIAEALVRAHFLGDSQMLEVSVMGASGAVSGVLGAFAVFSPRTPLYVMLIPIPIKARTAIWGFIIVSAVLMFTSSAEVIAHSAHIGGALTGLLFAWLLKRRYAANNEPPPLPLP
ncbi:MAG: rhomboid family intramembrane serine protease [Verrucomicrobiales bacterium]|jgi:membrane associated rhomboid family serine protease|nr:rhomboid family intramembrane serine protease [Verrucomicrobiales bacterium]